MQECKINIGCGKDLKEGYINIDNRPWEYPDLDILGADARYLPFKDNTVDEVYASHILEHMSYVDAIECVREWKRVLKVGRKLIIVVPDMDEIAKEWLKPFATVDQEIETKGRYLVFAIYGNHLWEGQEHRSAWCVSILDAMMSNVEGFATQYYRKDYTFWLWAEAIKL